MRQFLNRFLIWRLACFIFVKPGFADNISKLLYAGSFYPSTRIKLENTIERLTKSAKETHLQVPAQKSLKALILPHAGYIYSGLTAAHAALVLTEKQFLKVILMGPDHKIGFKNCAVSNFDAYQTPLDLIKLNQDGLKSLFQQNIFQSFPESDRLEHSIEVILPFLQYYLKEFELVPIVMGPGNINRITSAIEKLIDQDTLLVASSDLSHYMEYSKAVVKDKETIKLILNFDSDKLMMCDKCACGKIPILIVIKMARRHSWQPVFLHYSNSGDTAGNHSMVVGYTAIAFYGDSILWKKTVQRTA